MATAQPWKTVVWEWIGTDGRWKSYSPKVSHLLEKSYENVVNIVCLGEVEKTLKHLSVNMNEFVAYSDNTAFTCPVRRKIYSCEGQEASGIFWQWEGNHPGEWEMYNNEMTDCIENGFKQKWKNIDLSKWFQGSKYSISFQRMLQYNNITGFKRRVRRIEMSSFPQEKDDVLSTNSVQNDSQAEEKLSTQNELKENSNGTDYSDTSGYPVPTTSLRAKTDLKKCDSKSASCSTSSKDAHLRNCNAVRNKKKKRVTAAEMIVKSVKKYQNEYDSRGSQDVSFINNDGASEVIDQFCKELTISIESEDCSICCVKLSEESPYDKDPKLVSLDQCNHAFHHACLITMYNSGPKDGHIQCPICNKIYGVKKGNQPPGSMDVQLIHHSLPGYSHCKTLCITYNIRPGVQGPEHPNPGKPYTARGFPRKCYLPDTDKGRKVLELLRKAWDRRLIFTIATSATTSESDTVTWNGIHHKTEMSSSTKGYGYPDPKYLDNVLKELSVQGITE
ncbi:E3 ubiquitin-protein ligase DTX4-like isoform X1 [Limulus polyphemus]|uniref:E3 ubiquitin-protein ligase n=1 Tax=Limulus polyphemus TaxID=6850 RepID=A0ABM1BG79_LIMPO|nr:E3 ubiquitin-protein ligase DTX4-like isoform X1 [Limulus polyphemus]XP_022249313.1 E3 ubiquitin-protein ligase DTX4-like isoform X1 [Limulus polyphemus]